MLRLLLPLLLCLPLAVSADSYSPAPGDRVTLGHEGLSLSAPDASAGAPLPFGSPFHASMAALTTVLGHEFSVYLPEECPAGPVVVASFPRTLDLIYQEDRLVGWMLRPGSDLTTQAGVGIGSPVEALGGLVGLEVFDSSLGWEFRAGGLSGLLSDAAGSVEHLWSGTVCIFR